MIFLHIYNRLAVKQEKRICRLEGAVYQKYSKPILSSNPNGGVLCYDFFPYLQPLGC